MAAIQAYARIKVFVDGTELTQITSLRVRTDSGLQPVNLMNEGLGGFTEGSGLVTIEIGYAIPIGGQEYKFQQKTADREFVTIQIIAGGETWIGTGKFDTSEFSQSVGANAEGTATWMGPLARMEGGI